MGNDKKENSPPAAGVNGLYYAKDVTMPYTPIFRGQSLESAPNDEIIRGHFWFSATQKNIARQVRHPPVFVRLDSGEVVECTEAMDERGVPACLDSVYLGEGEVLR